MIRGFLGGVLWGGLLAIAALAVVSQVAPPPTGHPLEPVSAAGPVAVAVAEQEAAAPTLTPEVDAQPPLAEAGDPATSAQPEGTAPAASAGADTTSAPPAQEAGPDTVTQSTGETTVQPEQGGAAAGTAGSASEAIASTAPGSDAASAATDTDPVASAPISVPEGPAATTEADPASLPATGGQNAGIASVAGQSTVPDAPLAEVAASPPQVATDAPSLAVAPADTHVPAPDPLAEAAPPTVASAPARPAASSPDPAPGPAASIPAPVVAEAPPAPVEPPPADAPAPLVPAEAPQAEPTAPPASPEVAAADAPPPAADQPEPAPDVVASAEGAAVTRPSRLVPDAGLGSDAGAPRAARLPRIIGPAAEPEPEAAATDPVQVEAEAGLAEDLPAIERFAREFENPAGQPLFAIVLIDDGDPALDRRSLAAMPFPVTFLLDPSRPESAMAASIYREGGQEVAMLATGLPQGATASDLEVTFAAYGDVLPEAVAIVDLEEGGFQGDRALATMVAPIAAGQGRGLLSWDRGLNAAEQVARRAGLRSGVIYRRLDGEGEEAGTMRRYLDRAAFKAAQDGRVIVAGGTRAETVAALLEWAVEGRATTVALAPLSAALQAD